MKNSTEEAERMNAQTFINALRGVNDANNRDRSLLVPSGFDFSMFPVEAVGLHDITIVIDGNIRATQNFKLWNITRGNHVPWIHMINCTNLNF